LSRSEHHSLLLRTDAKGSADIIYTYLTNIVRGSCKVLTSHNTSRIEYLIPL